MTDHQRLDSLRRQLKNILWHLDTNGDIKPITLEEWKRMIVGMLELTEK